MNKKLNFLIMVILLFLVSCSDSRLKNETEKQDIFKESKNEMVFEKTQASKEIIETTEEAETSHDNVETTETLETIKYDSEDLLILDTSEPKIIDKKILFENKKLYPKVDGSTALMPLMARVRSNALGISLEDAENDTSCSKTNMAWNNLFFKYADDRYLYRKNN